MPLVWPSGRRSNAYRRLSVLLRLQGLWRPAQTQARRLLCILLLWLGAMSADPGRKLLLAATELVQNFICTNKTGSAPSLLRHCAARRDAALPVRDHCGV